MSSESHDSVPDSSDEEKFDVGSLFRGTATFTFVIEIVSLIMLLGSGVAYILSRSGLIETLNPDVAILLLLAGAMITLFFFMGTIGFFIRFNRKISKMVIGVGIGEVDLNRGRVKSVIVLYVLAIGLILIMGMYSYWLVYIYYLVDFVANSLSAFGLVLSFGIFLMAFLLQIVIIALGRTATRVVRAVLAEDV
ncbi:MAG: conserved membrane protein of unknown function [Candidatus Thorarchaeota archaeon]|nr:MAG: conserved membrane protein of unknown function [Candidatus Thorarchaeota archaeon]